MGNQRISVSFSELKQGMIVASDVEQGGRVIIKKGVEITEPIIERLQRIYYIGTIEVYGESENKQEKRPSEKKLIEFNKIEDELSEISVSLKSTLNKICSNNDDGFLDDIQEFTRRIKEEIEPHSLIIKNVVLHGSGSDVIYRHGVNVSALSALLGMWIGLSEQQLNLLVYSALLHDCGKMKVDFDLLYKPGRFTESEYNEIKKHSELGYDMVKKVPNLDKSVSYGVLMHHERMDGSGYPLGIMGDKIHTFGRIIAVADVFDAINSDRGYEKKKAPFEALRIVQEEGLGRLDYQYVKIFLEHIVNYYLGEEVLLNNGDRCKILQMNTNAIQRPLVLKDGEFIDLTKHKELYIKEMLL
ncbi:MAG: HD-GYP domain-containing protein [Clostridium sp.]|nr:HD-GYP domain-containing protein [Clostridium sp.]